MRKRVAFNALWILSAVFIFLTYYSYQRVNSYDKVFASISNSLPEVQIAARRTLSNAAYIHKNKAFLNQIGIDANHLQFIHHMPKLLHFIWISDSISTDEDNDVPAIPSSHIDSFRRVFNKGWIVIVWNNKAIRNTFCESTTDELCQYLVNKTLSDSFKMTLSVKSDGLRYRILSRLGGVYLDSDFLALRNMDQLLFDDIDKYGLIVCNERDQPNLEYMSGGFIAAYPNNICTATANAYVVAAMKKQLRPNERTGPYFWKKAIAAAYYDTDVDDETMNISGVLIEDIAVQWPTDRMYYFKWEDNDNVTVINHILNANYSFTYAVHIWAASWLEASKEWNLKPEKR